MSEYDGGLVVPGGQNTPLAVPADWAGASKPSGFRTSLDRSEPQERKRIVEILLGKGEDVSSWLNKPFVLSGYLLSPATFPDRETGEEVSTIVTRLISEDGSWCETHSAGVFRSLSLLVEMLGGDKLESLGKVHLVREKLSKSERSWITLRLCSEPKNKK